MTGDYRRVTSLNAMEIDAHVNSLTVATYVRLYNTLLGEEKQSWNSLDFDMYAIRGKYPKIFTKSP